MNFKVVHTTKYTYDGQVSLCHNESRIIPRNMHGQICNNSRLTILPYPDLITERTDFFGNTVHHFSIEKPHKELIITAESSVTRTPMESSLQVFPSTWETVFQDLNIIRPDLLEARQFIHNSNLVQVYPEIKSYAAPSFQSGMLLYDAILDLNHRIFSDFNYVPGATTVSTPLPEVLRQKQGVCQDFAHLAIACVRSFGLAARYVSGYIETLPPPGQEKLVGSDASHAWFSVYFPGYGWIDFDPTNNQVCGEKHITVAWGRDYSDVIPVKGVIFSSAQHVLDVSVDVRSMEIPA